MVSRSSGDHTPRWRPGERLHHLYEQRCDLIRDSGEADHLAVSAGDESCSYDELDARANRLARHLLHKGVRPGDRVGLLFDQALYSYVGMLAVLKVNAAYVPLDVGFPAERITFITEDAGLSFVLSQQHLDERLTEVPASTVFLDTEQAAIADELPERLTDAERGEPVDELAYVIYTSGSTGTPKGVAVEHASICNFVRVAAENYGFGHDDRVYQGLTVAFDFSVEEIWVPWMAGATLVPKPSAASLVGEELGEFLVEQEITALCCVPTLLASLETDLPNLRVLLVSGEACPQDLVRRWSRPGRRFLNVYGPTEATVTATWTLLEPDRPVTLGVPLPTYSVVILDPDEPRALPNGSTGEISIAGIGLAREYLNRPERTAQSFIDDFLGLEHNPSGRIYRTGDLGTVNSDGEIEYHGRIDTQVKIRGYRIELTEIESVLLGVPGIAQAVVDTHDPGSGVPELVAYYSLSQDGPAVDAESIQTHLREHLPAYMVPAYLEHLDAIPLLPSDKADRKNLPAPTTRSRAGGQEIVAPRDEKERKLAVALASALGLNPAEVSVDADFFDGLGANSLLLARFRTQLRQDGALPAVSMREVYAHRTVESLAAALPDVTEPAEPASATEREPAHRVSTLQYVLSGIGQFAAFGAYLYLLTWLFTPAFDWIADAEGIPAVYGRSILVGPGFFVALCAAPVLLKWVLIGRFKTTRIPLWGLNYIRFWLVKTLLRVNPMMMFVGTPLYSVYLRSLGAKIGPDVLILTRYLPICTDLITIGAHSVIRKDVFFNGYRGEQGRIHTGPITIGAHSVVGEGSVLDISSEMGDRTQLAHASALHSGQTLPSDTRWHGSPAEQTGVDYLNVNPAPVPSRTRKALHVFTQLLPMVLLYLPITLGGVGSTLLEGRLQLPIGTPLQASFYTYALGISATLFFGVLVFGVLMVTLVPRLLGRALRPGRTYPLYGLHYGIQRLIFRLSNAKFFMRLFGDSSYITYYLHALGYRLHPVEQTGSNFGVQQQHETPFLTSIGTGTMVSDGLSMINAWHSSTSFRMEHAEIGTRNFLGNMVRYPAGGRTGDNVLFGTKVMVPLDGEVQENTGLLGSPAFSIPRSVKRDVELNHPRDEHERRRAVRAKTQHNTVTLALFVASLWVYSFGLVTLALLADYFPTIPALTDTGAELMGVILTAGYFALLERAVMGFRRLEPRECSIYDRAFWQHERFWKFATPLMPVLDGTPLKPVLLRALGVRVGRQVYDDGCAIPEKSLVRLGDGCALNMGSVVQGHSLEDGGFKSDHIVLESDTTLRVGAFAHYGTTIRQGTTLDSDSFLMKGEDTGQSRMWRGNPATESSTVAPAPAAPAAVRSGITTELTETIPPTDSKTLDVSQPSHR